jgi:hypothetical protein
VSLGMFALLIDRVDQLNSRSKSRETQSKQNIEIMTENSNLNQFEVQTSLFGSSQRISGFTKVKKIIIMQCRQT